MPNTLLTGWYKVGWGASQIHGVRTSYHTQHNLKTHAGTAKMPSSYFMRWEFHF